MFHEVEPDRHEQMANRVADLVASLWFPFALAVGIVVWVLVNVIAEPFDTHPMVMIGGLGAALSCIAAFQGPLILLAQRHAAKRDRARDIETFRVAANSERDLHKLNNRLDRIEELLQRQA